MKIILRLCFSDFNLALQSVHVAGMRCMRILSKSSEVSTGGVDLNHSSWTDMGRKYQRMCLFLGQSKGHASPDASSGAARKLIQVPSSWSLNSRPGEIVLFWSLPGLLQIYSTCTHNSLPFTSSVNWLCSKYLGFWKAKPESFGDFLLYNYKVSFPRGKVKQSLLKWGRGSGREK